MGKVSPHKCLLILTTPFQRYFLTPVPLWMDSRAQAASKADGPGLFAFPALYSFSE